MILMDAKEPKLVLSTGYGSYQFYAASAHALLALRIAALGIADV